MPQSLSKILLHIVFGTKNRANLIPEYLLNETHAYIATICRNNKCEAYRVGGIQNHVHIACTLSRTISTSQLIKEIKIYSSKWIKERDPMCSYFNWQPGFGVFSINQDQLPVLLNYIDNQKEHHLGKSFKEELLEILEQHDLKCDEKYLWD